MNIFFWIFNMSVCGSVAGLLVLLLRRFRKIPRRAIKAFWALPFLRFCLPFGLYSGFGLGKLLEALSSKSFVYSAAVGTGHIRFSAINSTHTAQTVIPVVYKKDVFADIFRITSIVWAVVAAAIAITLFALYFATVIELKDAKRVKGNVFVSEKVTTAAVYGIFRPRIILPANYAERDIDAVLEHERTHIKSGDNLWRVLAFLCAAVHWFNPLAWLFLKKFTEDIEFACDEKVLAGKSVEEQKRYASALLNCAESRSLFASAFGGAKVRVRIERILSYKKMSVLASLGLCALAAVLTVLLLTN